MNLCDKIVLIAASAMHGCTPGDGILWFFVARTVSAALLVTKPCMYSRDIAHLDLRPRREHLYAAEQMYGPPLFCKLKVKGARAVRAMYSAFVGELRSPGHDGMRCALFLSNLKSL